LKSIDFRHLDSGSAQASLNRNLVYPIKVAVPGSIDEQRAISILLSSIDQRIALLHRTNAALESIAQAVFKSWFIDYDPVLSKAKGREPDGMDASTAALFPSELGSTSIGLLPLGWRVGKLGDVCTNPRKQAKPADMPTGTLYIGLEHMPRKSIALDAAGTAEGLESGKFWFERNDVLFGKLRPYFHKVGLAPFRGVCSTDILVLRPTVPKWLGFLAMHASSAELITHTTQLSNGARMPRTSWHDVAEFTIVIPSDGIAEAFNDRVAPLFQRIYANIETAKVLADLRDALHPSLISGKTRLAEFQEELRELIA
jgi:type I restriction enzyme S subunit